MSTLAIFQSLGPFEMGIILILALLLFGRRLPEVGKSLGKGIVEFKKGIKGIEDEIEAETTRPTSPPIQNTAQTQVQAQPQAKADPPTLPESQVDPRIPQSAQIHERVKDANDAAESGGS